MQQSEPSLSAANDTDRLSSIAQRHNGNTQPSDSYIPQVSLLVSMPCTTIKLTKSGFRLGRTALKVCVAISLLTWG